MQRTRLLTVVTYSILLVIAGCTGEIGKPVGKIDPTSGGGPSSMTGGTGNPPPPDGSLCKMLGINPGRAPLRRLNLAEYRNTVRDLLGETGTIVDGFPPDEEGLGFTNNADAQF